MCVVHGGFPNAPHQLDVLQHIDLLYIHTMIQFVFVIPLRRECQVLDTAELMIRIIRQQVLYIEADGQKREKKRGKFQPQEPISVVSRWEKHTHESMTNTCRNQESPYRAVYSQPNQLSTSLLRAT